MGSRLQQGLSRVPERRRVPRWQRGLHLPSGIHGNTLWDRLALQEKTKFDSHSFHPVTQQEWKFDQTLFTLHSLVSGSERSYANTSTLAGDVSFSSFFSPGGGSWVEFWISDRIESVSWVICVNESVTQSSKTPLKLHPLPEQLTDFCSPSYWIYLGKYSCGALVSCLRS